MISTHFPVYAVFQRLDGGFVLSERRAFPEISMAGLRREKQKIATDPG
ncbi:MAG TPA: hypothetical protein VMG10_06370 [Gemmataceae bacterium]|nr:hypothetical protein [Gemmataceae bacterium]